MSIFSLTKYLSAILLIFCFAMCKKQSPSPTPQEIIAPNDIIETAPAEVTGVTHQLNASFRGYYVALPQYYEKTTKKYPVIIYLHGAGQIGNGSSELRYVLNDGIGKILKDQKLPPDFNIGGKHYSFIVVSPQTSRIPQIAETAEFINYIKQTFRVDEKRVYLSGLSAGARVATLVGAAYPDWFAAMIPMAGVSAISGLRDRCDSMAVHNLPVWAFHNIDDPMSDVHDTENFVSLLNEFSPEPLPLLTIFNVYGHDAWTTPLNPSYRERGINIYEWMLQYSR